MKVQGQIFKLHLCVDMGTNRTHYVSCSSKLFKTILNLLKGLYSSYLVLKVGNVQHFAP